MKVLHITNEFTKKNFSISSLIIYISSYLYKKYHINSSILISSLEEKFFDKKNISIINFKNWIDYLFKKNELIRFFGPFKVIHIHGIWAPIQLISLIICINNNKRCIVHPHGMLLGEALKSAGFLKYILKKLSLFFLQKIINNQVSFVSITNQETEAISNFFPDIEIVQISNPVPFETNRIVDGIKKKKIVYFGRIHPHKNIHLVIQSFIKANLEDDWKLEIYGILDDASYYKHLKKVIGKNKKIIINEPVFGVEKQKIMSEAWLNILVSKSEVLSLSILESSLFGLPTLVNKEIEISGNHETIIFTDINEDSIAKKIQDISKWSLEDRIFKQKKIIEVAKNQSSIEDISLKYTHIYNNIKEDISDLTKDYLDEETSFVNLFKKNLNFLMISSTYMFNLMFASFLVVSLVVLGDYSTAGELGLVTSFWITVTQIFSSNMRSIVISEDKSVFARQSLIYRIIFSIITLSAFFTISHYYFDFDNQILINVTSFLIMVQWINEMNLVQYEIKNSYKYFKNFLIINIIVVLFTGYFLFIKEIVFLTYLMQFYTLVILFLILKNIFSNYRLTNYNIKNLISLNLKTIAFLSSFSIIISSFAWRIMIYYIFNKSLAGIFFACFSIGSFPGTLFNSVIGPAFIKQRISISKKVKNFSFLLFLIILSGVFASIYYLATRSDINYLGSEFIFFTISLSLLGSYFMSYAMYLRHKQIQSTIEIRTYLFKRDIFYGISITFLIPLLYFFGGTLAVSFAFIMASIVAMVSYSINLPNVSSKKL